MSYMRFIKNAALIVALLLAFYIAPAAPAGASEYSNRIKPPDAASFLDDGYYSAETKYDSLKRIIELNVVKAKKIPVLLYHHLKREGDIAPDERENSTILSVERFEEQMRHLYKNKFYTATVAELEMYIKGEILLPERTVVITFDDGYKSNADFAYPILKRYDFKAGIFLITRLIGESGEKEFLGWDSIRECGDVFTYHSHSHDLHKRREDGRTDFTIATQRDALNDLVISANVINTGYFAYPHGQIGKSSRELLRTAGYRMAFGLTEAYVAQGADLYDIPRFIVTPQVKPDLFEAICGGTYDWR
jgi:peptidoglycan/xylan/chitin deacetylase (PgdA/CDA1 family)